MTQRPAHNRVDMYWLVSDHVVIQHFRGTMFSLILLVTGLAIAFVAFVLGIAYGLVAALIAWMARQNGWKGWDIMLPALFWPPIVLHDTIEEWRRGG